MRHPDRNREHYGAFLASYQRNERKAQERQNFWVNRLSVEEAEARANDMAHMTLWAAPEVHHV